MSDFSQLGLFSQSAQKIDGSIAFRPSKFSFTVEFSELFKSNKDEVIKKIAEDLHKIDKKAQILIGEEKSNWQELPFLAIDVETTGLDAAANRVIEVAFVPFNMQKKPVSMLFSVGEPLSKEIISITGITDDMLKDQPTFSEHADDFLKLLKEAAFVTAYNARFDQPFLESEFARLNKVMPKLAWVDPFIFICELDRFKRGKKLTDAAIRWGVPLENAHRAMDDAKACGQLLLKMADKIDSFTLNELLDKQKLFQWRHEHNRVELKKANPWR
jgi:DNA polymerase-3 subunit alpha (Gram-positive type)